jgi:hypothetical protein
MDFNREGPVTRKEVATEAPSGVSRHRVRTPFAAPGRTKGGDLVRRAVPSALQQHRRDHVGPSGGKNERLKT